MNRLLIFGAVGLPNTLRNIQNILYKHMYSFGYQTFKTPIIEPAELFLTKAGDKLIDRLFTFERRGQQLTLRPEFTASAIKHYIELATTDVVRWQFSGATFEDKSDNHSNRNYQQYSIGAELIGDQNIITADAEIIAMAIEGILKLGLRNYQLIIGQVGLLRSLLDSFNLDRQTQRLLLNKRNLLKQPSGKSTLLEEIRKTLRMSDTPQQSTSESSDHTEAMLQVLLETTRKSQTMGGRTQNDIVQRLVQRDKRAIEESQITSAIEFLEKFILISGNPVFAFNALDSLSRSSHESTENILDEWKNTVEMLSAYGITNENIILQPDLSRHWDYYTGLVFGIKLNDHLVAAGGRYDELARLLGSQNNVPAVGFAYYINELQNSFPEFERDTPIVITVYAKNELFADAVKVAQHLRKKNISVITTQSKPASLSNTVIVEQYGRLRFHEKSGTMDNLERFIADVVGELA